MRLERVKPSTVSPTLYEDVFKFYKFTQNQLNVKQLMTENINTIKIYDFNWPGQLS
jgi:hypothetical protein